MEYDILPICAAALLDLAIGDPHWLPHPTRGIGYLITFLEKILYPALVNKKLGGICLLVFVLCITYTSAKILLNITGMVHPVFRLLIEVFIIFSTISIKDLYKESMSVYKKLLENNLYQSRKNLARIVGRDTETLTESDIARGAIESTAEGIVDGILSPLFFAAIGGAPGALVYKAINTLDSMVGYRNERYRDFGWASAKLDDIANYIPARLSGILIPFAALCCQQNGFYSLLTVMSDGKKHPSPNSGFPEAGMAGALTVQLGGKNYYQGVPSIRPLIGGGYRTPEVRDIREANRIMVVTSLIMVILILFMG